MLEIATYTGGLAATNGYACEKDARCFVVDAPAGMAHWLEENGRKPVALLLTHAHFDHVLDAAAIQRRYGCPIYAFADPAPELTLEVLVESWSPAMKIEPYEVDHHVSAQEAFEVAGMTFDVLEIPGHSPDSVAFLSRGESVIFVGDVLMKGSIGRDDLPGGDGPRLREGIRRHLFTLDDALEVLPGHGEPTRIGVEKRSNPFVRV